MEEKKRSKQEFPNHHSNRYTQNPTQKMWCCPLLFVSSLPLGNFQFQKTSSSTAIPNSLTRWRKLHRFTLHSLLDHHLGRFGGRAVTIRSCLGNIGSLPRGLTVKGESAKTTPPWNNIEVIYLFLYGTENHLQFKLLLDGSEFWGTYHEKCSDHLCHVWNE